MRNALVYIMFIIGIGAGCTSIDNLEPNQTETFLKFYSETNEMNSKDLIVLNDGYLVLSTYSTSATLLLKTDLLGNKMWAQSIDDFQGSALAVIDDGYILIGDGININNDSTYMQLIKTDFNGTITNNTSVGYGAQHGSAVVQSSSNEIIGLGYTSSGQLNDTNDTTYVIITGFDSNLSQTWDTVRTNPVIGVDITPSNSVYEADNGTLTWISYSSKNEVFTNIELTAVPPDSETPVGNLPLFTDYAISNHLGDIVKTSIGFAIVKTVNENGSNKIGITTTINGGVSDTNIIALDGNTVASSITNSTNGLLIAASQNKPSSSDVDLLLLEVDFSGQVAANGINISYGGDGDELPVRIRKTNDGGYIVLGTLINTKGAKQTFILKTDNKGALN